MPWETIREEYVLTNELRAEYNQDVFAKLRAMAAKKHNVSPEEIDMTNVEAFYILEGAYIDAALQLAVKEYGSMDGYIREGLGITDTEIEALRTQLLQ